MRRRAFARSLIVVVLSIQATAALGQPQEAGIDAFLDAAAASRRRAAEAQKEIAAGWRDGDAAMLVDLLDIVQRTRDLNPRTFMPPDRFARFLEEQTGQTFGEDLARWQQWVWNLPYSPHPDYVSFPTG